MPEYADRDMKLPLFQVVRNCLDDRFLLKEAHSLNPEKVRYLVIGTHGRAIEGRLLEGLSGRGWRLEIERAAIYTIEKDRHSLGCDGIQGWLNPALFSEGELQRLPSAGSELT